MKSYENSENKPIFESTGNAFKIVLPNINTHNVIKKSTRLSETENKVMVFVNVNGFITRSNVEKLLDVSPATANRLLKKMTEKNLLLKSGRGNTTKYVSLD